MRIKNYLYFHRSARLVKELNFSTFDIPPVSPPSTTTMLTSVANACVSVVCQLCTLFLINVAFWQNISFMRAGHEHISLALQTFNTHLTKRRRYELVTCHSYTLVLHCIVYIAYIHTDSIVTENSLATQRLTLASHANGVTGGANHNLRFHAVGCLLGGLVVFGFHRRSGVVLPRFLVQG